MDAQIGLVLETLEELGVRDEFVVHYTSDHGEMAGEHGLWGKHCFYEESVRVPMILSGPGIPAGRRVQENVSHVDVYPTLCELGGLPVPDGLRGQSMLPLLEQDTPGRRTVFSEVYSGGNVALMAKRGDVKYIWYSEGAGQLFDLSQDPEELDNRADDPAYAESKQELHDALAALPEPRDDTDADWTPPDGMPFTPTP
jgi:choline-sulfatase